MFAIEYASKIIAEALHLGFDEMIPEGELSRALTAYNIDGDINFKDVHLLTDLNIMIGPSAANFISVVIDLLPKVEAVMLTVIESDTTTDGRVGILGEMVESELFNCGNMSEVAEIEKLACVCAAMITVYPLWQAKFANTVSAIGRADKTAVEGFVSGGVAALDFPDNIVPIVSDYFKYPALIFQPVFSLSFFLGLPMYAAKFVAVLSSVGEFYSAPSDFGASMFETAISEGLLEAINVSLISLPYTGNPEMDESYLDGLESFVESLENIQ